ncbi:P-loop containing nucleoside triphosphate hydrolase [Glarea lozoyensis ATCC 20868]|uniref:p-loop containing nucleoside triphosphate hydrolase n=1 Tax=Glarea lozoyensis (strain ATCC 20868 / MF5171) TaxID=1116229 RepID=S3DLQ5_GLAL2|nr:P-loop containing nucleoside triphosphate hydrolase [Glarea lozoyensis ATCC 20868]EPE32991.1 P-loop containing nucleoside triphosphate hydrolase [Glarea lozoyensis ATCC 20868]
MASIPEGPPAPAFTGVSGLNPQTALLDAFFPGFSLISTGLLKYTKIDLSLYLPMVLATGAVIFSWRYLYDWTWELIDKYAMSSADIRIDDEMYNMLMGWIANQNFAKSSRKFVANTNLNSRMWYLWRDDEDEEDEDDDEIIDFDKDSNPVAKIGGKQEKKVRFTPSFGTHYFWYKGKLLQFRRIKDERQQSYGSLSEREEVSVACFGRDPSILKTLLDECRTLFLKSDESRTVIYRGNLKSTGGASEPQWTRCISRVSRPFSTVVLDESVKQKLLDDMRDYLHPYTRRWYSNRGIPYRRGYLLYGPPGTGKSSLSFAIAGYFKLKIYIVSLNSPSMDEEHLSTLFADLPKQCVVLLEDIDTAGLTHTREDPSSSDKPTTTTLPGNTLISSLTPPASRPGRISLSALLNIIDGVASQEGRVLIMTTNHKDKLDEALIRPGRVDMTVEFNLASTSMLSTIFRGIYATLEGDIPDHPTSDLIRTPSSSKDSEIEELRLRNEFLAKRKRDEEEVERLAEEFASKIPSGTFSPAEVQGYLLKHKREPEVAVRGAEEWVVETKRLKERVREREMREENERAKAEKEAAEKKEKEDAEEKAKEEGEKGETKNVEKSD